MEKYEIVLRNDFIINLYESYVDGAAGLGGSVGCASNWWSEGCEYNPHSSPPPPRPNRQSATLSPGDLIMKFFLLSSSPFRWFKKGSCQFLAGTRFSLRDKRLFEIREFEIATVNCIYYNIHWFCRWACASMQTDLDVFSLFVHISYNIQGGARAKSRTPQ